MKHPQVIVLAFDDWLAKQLREFLQEYQWILHEVRQTRACLTLIPDTRPTVVIVQIDPHAESLAPFEMLGELQRLRPDVATVVVSDVKLPDADRIAWTLGTLDLGARCVLFPPLSRTVLEDVVSGLMEAVIQRSQIKVAVQSGHSAQSPEPIIDLASEGLSSE